MIGQAQGGGAHLIEPLPAWAALRGADRGRLRFGGGGGGGDDSAATTIGRVPLLRLPPGEGRRADQLASVGGLGNGRILAIRGGNFQALFLNVAILLWLQLQSRDDRLAAIRLAAASASAPAMPPTAAISTVRVAAAAAAAVSSASTRARARVRATVAKRAERRLVSLAKCHLGVSRAV